MELDDKKITAFEKLVSEWIGEIGTMDASVREFIQRLEASKEVSADLFAQFDVRCGKVYSELLEAHANLQLGIEGIEKAALAGANQLEEKMAGIDQQATQVVTAMIALQKAVSGEGGLSVQVQQAVSDLKTGVWKFEQAAQRIDNLQTSRLAKHSTAISALQTLAAIVVSFSAGISYGAADSKTTALAVSAVAVGCVVVGWLLSWVIHDKLLKK